MTTTVKQICGSCGEETLPGLNGARLHKCPTPKLMECELTKKQFEEMMLATRVKKEDK